MTVNTQSQGEEYRYLEYFWGVSGRQPLTPALISPRTHAISYASSVFEGVRFYSGVPFALEEHLSRLSLSAQLVGIHPALDTKSIAEAVVEASSSFSHTNGYLRILVWNNSQSFTLRTEQDSTEWCVLVALTPSTLFDAETPLMSLWLSDYSRGNWPAGFDRAKWSGGYAIGGKVLTIANELGCDDAVLLDADLNVCESTGANIIARFGEKLVTPYVGPALDGITLRYLEKITKGTGFEINRDQISKNDLVLADEVILCGTSYEIRAVRNIRQHQTVRKLESYPAADKLRALLRKLVS